MTKSKIFVLKAPAKAFFVEVQSIYHKKVGLKIRKTLSAYKRADAFVCENFKQQAVLNASV